MINHSAGSSQLSAVGTRAARLLVLLAAFICAACGLVYELELVALGSYLLGNSVTQASVVLSVMVFAMGVGSLLAKRFTRRPATSFALVESALALVGGLSVLVLYGCFVWIGHYQVALVVVAFVIGTLIGAEIPLLMTLIQRIRRQEAGRAVADLFAADYIGALVGGLAFPFLLLPILGQATGALLTGGVNAVAGAVVVLWLFPSEPSRRVRSLLWGLCGTVLVLLAVAAALTGAFERAARHALYGAPIRFSSQSRYQEIVLTGPSGGTGGDGSGGSGTGGDGGGDGSPSQAGQARTGGQSQSWAELGAGQDTGPGSGPGAGPGGDGSDRVPPPRTADDGYPLRAAVPSAAPSFPSLRLYLGGRLAVCGSDEARYHAALVRPALAGPRTRVLVLGGGDGLAAHEALRYAGVAQVTVVEIDPEVLWLGRTDPELSQLNQGALNDPRVRTVTADAFTWLRTAPRQEQPYDVIISDLPEPGLDQSRKLYTTEFYGLVRRMLAPDGRLVVHAGSVAGDGFWDADDTLHATGLHTAEYSVPADRSCGGPTDWGFILAAVRQPQLRLPDPAGTGLVGAGEAGPNGAGPGASGPGTSSSSTSGSGSSDPSGAAGPDPAGLDAAALRLAAALADARRPARDQIPSTLLHPRL
ncbi:spermidine synthase [Streptacidiphilus sp. EB129]|uniref:spermine/spermidine synthase domain-containing protein n=1 Tax=Streptacidiphilus sp. EB129 TaxID=3156262 RepID=UPI0035124DFC